MKNVILMIISLMIISFLGCNQGTTPSDTAKMRERRDSLNKVERARLAELNKPWKTNTFKDSFGDPTGDKFIYTNVQGTFRNSATSGSDLYTVIYITKTDLGIFLHEYSLSSPSATIIGDCSIMLKNGKEEVISLKSDGKWNDNGGILINTDLKKALNFFKQSEGEIKFVISTEYSSKYNFTISTAGLAEELKNL